MCSKHISGCFHLFMHICIDFGAQSLKSTILFMTLKLLVHQIQLYVECGSLGVQSSLVLCKINEGTQSKRRKEMTATEVRQAKETEV